MSVVLLSDSYSQGLRKCIQCGSLALSNYIDNKKKTYIQRKYYLKILQADMFRRYMRSLNLLEEGIGNVLQDEKMILIANWLKNNVYMLTGR